MWGVLVLAALPLTVSEATPDTGAADRAAVALTFAWKPGIVAHVETELFKERVTGDEADTTSVHGTYVMNVKEHPDGLIIEDSDFESKSTSETDQDLLPDLEQRLAMMSPSMVISPEGKFVRIERLGEFKAQMDSVLASTIDMDLAPPELETMIQTLSSEQVLTAGANQWWNRLVGFWLGAELQPGAVYQLGGEEPIALIPGLVVPMVTEFELSGRVPCSGASDRDDDCVELIVRSNPKPGALEKLISDLGRNTSPNVPGVHFEEVKTESKVTVTMEPATMLPHGCFTHRLIEMKVRQNGEVQSTRQLEERSTYFTY